MNGDAHPPRREQRHWGIFRISLGGMVAMAWCDAYPSDFEHVTVSRTSAYDVSSTFERLRRETQPEYAVAIGPCSIARRAPRRATARRAPPWRPRIGA